MSLSGIRRFSQDQGAAVAPTVALALFALIGMGGIAFDYARLASLDTELQNAADQAALAAATQLDGSSGSIARATQAANDLISNQTRFANDGSGPDTAIGSLTFYSAYTNPTTNTVTTVDTAATVVRVDVATRRANYALTPVVGAFFGDVQGRAVAGIGGAVCGVVPFFICNPAEPVGNSDLNYTVTIAPGTGIKMLEGGDQKGPGNFGFLAYLGRGASRLEQAISTDVIYDECVASDLVTTETGQMTSVFDGLNRRFDMNTSCSLGPCSPSTNERKDLVRQANSCNWVENPATEASLSTNAPQRYRPTSNAELSSTVTPEIMGHPRDICHARGTTSYCSGGLIGDGLWDRVAYFRSNHPGLNWVDEPGLGPTVTRYQTYLWEAENTTTRLGGTTGKASNKSGWRAYGTPQTGVCNPPGIVPNTNGIDRRRMTAAVVNCRAYGRINGRRNLPVAGYIDVFLVEPSLNRTRCGDPTVNGQPPQPCRTAITERTDIYVEVIGAAGTGQGGAAAQITQRNVPRLIE